MSFKFTKKDEVSKIPAGISVHLNKVIENRVKEFNEFLVDLENEDYVAIRRFCHNVLGVALSYELHKLDEIVRYIQRYAKAESIVPIREVIPMFKDYLAEIQNYT